MMKDLEKRVLRFMAAPGAGEFEPLALELYARQRHQNPVYARYCEHLAVGPDLTSWKEIPALPQQAFKERLVASFPRSEGRFEFRTSGTTGEGYGRHLLPSLTLYRGSVLAGWRHFNLPESGVLLLMQHPRDAPHSSLTRMGAILVENQSEPFLVDAQGTVDRARLAATVGASRLPVVLFGTALAFLNWLERPGLTSLPAGSLLIETGGFKGSSHRQAAKADLYRELASRFRVEVENIWNEYGMTELSSQFYSRGVGNPHFGPPWVRFLVIDPETNREALPGKIGVLRILDLANVWSVLSIQTQDLAVARADGGFLLLGRDPKALPRGCSRAMDELLQLVRA